MLSRLPLRSWIAVALLLGVACAKPVVVVPPTPIPPPPPPAPLPITAVELDTLGEILRLEDRREFVPDRFENWSRSPSALVRRHAALGAGRIGESAAAPLLMRLLVDADSTVRADAGFALGELNDSTPAVVQALITASRAGSGSAALEAVAALGRVTASAGYTAVVGALQDPTLPAAVRSEALLAFARFRRTPSAFDIILPYMSDPDPETRWRALYALTQGGTDSRAVPHLLQWLRDPDGWLRALAARGLRVGAVDSAGRRVEVMTALQAALADAYAGVRINAVRALAAYRDPTHSTALTALLDDPDANVVLATVQVLTDSGHAGSALRSLARDTMRSLTLRNEALRTLVRRDPVLVAGVAREWVASTDWLRRLYGVRLLTAASPGPVIQQELRRITADPDPRVAAAALQALAADTTNPSYTLFIEKLADRDPAVRAAAARGLQRHGNATDLEPLMRAYERALQDTPRVALQAAINALGALKRRGVPVERSFFLRFKKPADPLVHQSIITQIGAGNWGPVKPIETGRNPAYYRAIAHRFWASDSSCNRPRVRIRTAPGDIVLELDPQEAPLTVLSFLTLAERGYFNNSRWHRVVPNFVLQDGEPRGDGNGGPGYTIRDEINRLRYGRGTLGMALSGPDTGGSQFFITHSPQPHLDGGYTIFGRVVEGMQIADRVTLDDPIVAIEVIR